MSRKTYLINEKLLATASVFALVSFAAVSPAWSGAIVPATGSTNVTGADTWDTNNNTQLGAVDADVVFTTGGVRSLLITDSTSGADVVVGVPANLQLVTTTANNAGTNTLTVGDGSEGMYLIVNGAISGDVATDANDLRIILDADDAAAKTTTLEIKDDVDLGGAGTITLNSDADGTAIIVFSGTSAQSVTAIINGVDDNDGNIIVTNSAGTGVTFNSAIGGVAAATTLNTIVIGSGTAAGTAVFGSTVETNGAITVGQNTQNGTATFKDDVAAAGGIIFGSGANVDTNIMNFTNAGAAYTVTGAISDANANDLNTLNVASTANTITFASAVDVGVADAIVIGSVDGASASAQFNAAVTAATIALGSGTTDGDINTITFGTGSSYNVTGAITAADSGDTNTINLNGDGNNTITFLSAVGNANVDSIVIGSVASNDVGATFTNAVTADAITLGASGGSGDETTMTVALTNAVGAKTIAGTIGTFEADNVSVLTIADTSDGEVAGSATFSGAVGGSTAATQIDTLNVGIDFDKSGVAIFGDTFYGNAVNVFGGDNTAEDSAVTFTGNMTAGAITLKAAVNGGVATATFTGNVTATSTTLDDNTDALSTVIYNGSTAQTVSGTVLGLTAGEGTVNVNNDVIFSSNVGATRLLAITVAANKTMTVGTSGSTAILGATTATVNGALKPLDTVTLAAGTALTFASGSTIEIVDQSVVTSSTAFIDADTNDATITVAAGTTVLTLPTNFRTGSFNLIDANGGATLTYTGAIVATDTSVTDYTVTNTSGLVTVSATSHSGATIAANIGDITSEAGNALGQALVATTNDSIVTAAYTTAIAAGGYEARKAADQSQNAPSVLGASTAIVASTGSAVLSTASNHLASLRSGAAFASNRTTSIATGGAPLSNAVWGKTFGNLVNQDKKDGIEGYDANTYGVAIGADLYQNNATTVGVAFSYANTNIDGDGLSNDETDINSYQLSVYGDYTSDKWYVEAYAAFARNDVETERKINFGGLNRIASGDYNGNQYMAKIGGGMPMSVGNNSFVTPTASFLYAHVSNDSYTETGAGALNLTVNPDDVDIAQASLGARLHAVIDDKNGNKFIPEIHLNALYDIAGDEAQSTSTYSGGGAAFAVTGAEVEKWGGNVGVGITYDMESISLSAGYDAELKNDYLGHTGLIEARFRF